MHSAALTNVSESYNKPIQYYRKNTFGSQSILESMINESINYFIVSENENDDKK